MQEFCVRGVVRGGQIVLEFPLDLPDKTTVFITGRQPDDVKVSGPLGRLPEPVVKQLILEARKRLDLQDDPEWEAKLRSNR